jgi:hypothetical protein
MDPQEKHHLLFSEMVIMLHAAAMHQLGKVKNPLTDSIERDLEAAQNTIDMLDMLKARTQGNLQFEEDRLLGQVLQELKLNYVDEVKASSGPSSATMKDAGKEKDAS